MTRPQEVRWLLKNVVLAIHDVLILEHGGTPGVRDDGLLDSALARPQHHLHYEPSSSLFRLAAVLAHGLSSNHAFVDGNKRIALTATAVFLEINGWRLEAPEAEAAVVFTELAVGVRGEDELARWLEEHCLKPEG